MITISPNILRWRLFVKPERVQVLVALLVMADERGVVSASSVNSLSSVTRLSDITISRSLEDLCLNAAIELSSDHSIIIHLDAVPGISPAVLPSSSSPSPSPLAPPSPSATVPSVFDGRPPSPSPLTPSATVPSVFDGRLPSPSPLTPPPSATVPSVFDGRPPISPQAEGGEPSPTPSPPPRRFRKPTLQELSAYISSKSYHFNAEEFLDYYDTVGWVVGRTRKPMKDWKAACRTFERNAKQSPRKSSYEQSRKEARSIYLEAEAGTSFQAGISDLLGGIADVPACQPPSRVLPNS